MDTRLKLEELESLIRDHRPEVLIGGDNCLSGPLPMIPDLESVRHVISCGPTVSACFISYKEMLSTSPAQSAGVELGAEDIATLGGEVKPSPLFVRIIFLNPPVCAIPVIAVAVTADPTSVKV